jgi:hypothetical protein
MVKRFGLRLHGYVLMDNHYHLIVELTEANLSLAMQWLNLSYSVWFNRRHDRSGHLFQGRFKSVVFSGAASGLELSRYVHLNPVRVGRLGLSKAARAAQRAGVAGSPDRQQVADRLGRLRRYRWSSYRAYIGTAACPPWLTCDVIGQMPMRRGSRVERKERYRQFVEAAVREGLERLDVWAELKEGAILGSERFVQSVREHITGDREEQRAAGRLGVPRPSWAALVAAVETVTGQRWEEFRDRYGDGRRDLVLYLGQQRCGMKLKELAAQSGMASYGAVAMAIRRYQQKVTDDPSAATQIKKITEMLNVKM